MLSERIARLSDRVRNTQPTLDLDRARLFTEFYSQPSMENYIIKRAKAFKNYLEKINRHSPYLSITLHKCYPYYLFGISTFPNLAYHSIALRKFSITIV